MVDHLVDVLAALGVTRVFGVGGANIEDLYDALQARPGVTGVLAKHEFNAATMADGHARTTSGLGVVAATSGGAALNLVPGLGEAYASRVPVLALVGQPPTGQHGKGAFQDSSGLAGSLSAAQVFAGVSRFCATVTDPDEFPELLAEALAATADGPAVLLLPKDIQQAEVDAPAAAVSRPELVATPEELVDLAADLADAARRSGRVIVIAGDGVARADARAELRAFAGALDARVAVCPDSKDVFDNTDPRFIGVAGIMGHPALARHLSTASACVLVGTRLPITARGGLDDLLAGIPVLSLDPETPYIDALALRGHIKPTLRALTERLGPVGLSTVVAEPAEFLAAPTYDGPRLGYTEVVDAIAKVISDDANVFIDAGNAGAAAIHRLPAPRHGRCVVALGMGGMGYTFGAGIGAAFSGRRTFVIAGDGAFLTHGLEIHTAVEYDLPITFVVLNNNAHAMCVTREQIYFGGGYTFNRFRYSDLAAGVAAMFPGIAAGHAASADQLRTALAHAGSVRGPAFVAIDCDPDEIPPFAPFLAKEDTHVHVHAG